MISNVLRNFIVYVDGVGKLGDGEEAQLPNIVEKTEEFLGGGMPAPLEMGLSFEKLEASFTLTSFDKDVLNMVGRMPVKQWPFTIRGYLESSNGDTGAAVASIHGRPKATDLSAFKVGEKMTNRVDLAVVRYRLRRDGEEIYRINLEAPEWYVGGVDQMTAMRRALGTAL